ncbi:hypothetical protein Tco_1421319, partial [Tanacetum coccineum]
MDYQCNQPSEIVIFSGKPSDIERQREIKERNRVHEETMQMLREMIKIQEEKRIIEEAARKEEEKRIAEEKEAAELEAKCKIQECLNTEEKSIPQASTRSRKFRIDPTLRNFTISTKHPIPFPSESTPSAITPDLPIPDSLIMEDEHLDTIPVTESANTIKSSVEELCPTQIDPHCFNAEFYLIESLLNRDTLIDSSPKFDYLLEEFSGELAQANPIPLGVVDTDSKPEEEIRLGENLSYDNSSPRPPEECNSEIADTIVESLSPPPIPIKDSDSLMEEIDLFLAFDDSMPPGIEI